MRLERISVSSDDVNKIDLCKTAEKLVLSFTHSGITVASAESCTGGLFGASVTEISGASAVYLGGVVSYTNEVKEKILGVSQSTLNEHTAVSEYTAAEMAKGVRDRLGSDFGVSVTGYAGPSGGDSKNPVGTVFVCVSGEGVSSVTRLSFEENTGREKIRNYAVYFMMSQLLKIVNL